MLDDITQAVLAREDVARYLRGGHGQSELQARERIHALPRRAADDAALPDLSRAASTRSIRSCARSSASTSTSSIAQQATRAGRVIYVSNHKSHLDYLVEPLVLDDNGIRPPVIAGGHQPVRRTARPAPPPRHRRDSDPAQHQGSRPTSSR